MHNFIKSLLFILLIGRCAKKEEKVQEVVAPPPATASSIFPVDNPAGESTAEPAEVATDVTPTASTTASDQPKAPDEWTITSDINVRQKGDTKSPVLKRLKKGDRVKCVSFEPKGWCQIAEGGYVAVKFLKN